MKLLLLVLLLEITCVQVSSQNIGIGTLTPTDKLHINSPLGTNPFRVQVNGTTKFRLWENGGVSIGSLGTAPANGLYINGPLQVQDSITSVGTLAVITSGDSIKLKAGNSEVIIAPDGNIIIRSAVKITIDATTDLELRGANISLIAQNGISMQASGTMGLTGALMNLNANPIRFNNGTRKISGIGDLVSCPPDGGTVPILTGSPNVFTN